MRAIPLLATAFLSGCAISTTRGPDPDRPRDAKPDCTSTDWALIVDGAIGASGLVFAVFGGVGLDKGSNDDFSTLLLVGGLGAFAVTLGSSYVGSRRVKRCRKALVEWERREKPGALAPQQEPAAPAR